MGKEMLERRLEDVEGTRNQQESLRLQEVEVENGQLRADLDRLRQAVAGAEKEMKRTTLSEKLQISLKLFKRNLIVGVKNVYS